MKITTLIEDHQNPSRKDLVSEHGLSFIIEMDGQVLMSDVGQSGKFVENADTLGVDLSSVEALAISHRHYDHGGGLRKFIKVNHKAEVYLRSCPSYLDFIAHDPDGSVHYIGLDKGLLRDYHHRLTYLAENEKVVTGFHLLTDIPAIYPKPKGDQRLKMRAGTLLEPDTFEHEMVMVFEGDQGLVILTGCAHNGVLNMIEATRRALPEKPILAVIGGFHLHHEDMVTVKTIGKLLHSWEIPRIITGHCTGDDAIDILADILGDRLIPLHTGLIMEF